jgi:site-specific recombinase XerD
VVAEEFSFMANLENDRRCSDFLAADINEFFIDRQARNFTSSTLAWYRRCLVKWQTFCLSLEIVRTEDVTASHVRRFLVHLGEEDSRGGVVWQGSPNVRSKKPGIFFFTDKE